MADQYRFKYWTYHLRKLALHDGCNRFQKQQYKQELWDLVHNDVYIENKYFALSDENIIMEDFIRAIAVFKPQPEDNRSTIESNVQKITSLGIRSSQTISQLANLARKKLHSYASEGDIIRVLQFANRAGYDSFEWFTLLRSAILMQQKQLESSPLFDAIYNRENPVLFWTDSAMLEKSIAEANIPKPLGKWMMEQIPES